ncbi:hypothetical protein SEA_ZHENGYI_6 [Microbacterium phage Zhengyi]|nr:hypothetical protein SEA_ZHENGYI_6 [Microbacterium phage Zhengyi]
MTDTTTPGDTYEIRHCFKHELHNKHVWHDKYYCYGQGIDDNGYVRDVGDETPAEAEKLRDETTPAPGILDGRAAYGDRVQNMKDQAAMINAYLGGRQVEAHDVPIIFVLVKAHRLGKMPDYADNYNDIDGYMQIAREVIGDNMIEAATAKEYQEIKRRGHQGDGRVMDSFIKARHPYENIEDDE